MDSILYNLHLFLSFSKGSLPVRRIAFLPSPTWEGILTSMRMFTGLSFDECEMGYPFYVWEKTT